MRFQSGSGFCGPAAVANVLRALGIKATEAQVAQHTGTTAGLGTTENGLKQGIERFGCSHEELNERKYATAENRLLEHLKNGPALLLAESGDHWVAVIGTLADRVVIFDSQLYAFNRKENGVHLIQTGNQLRRYWLPFEGKRYAILVSKT